MRAAPIFRDFESIIAVHEAGHAVVCVKLGVPFTSVSIELDGTCPYAGVESEAHLSPYAEVRDGGRRKWERDGEVTHELAAYMRRCRKQVIVCFAGRAAEERAARLRFTSGVGIDSDVKDLRDARYFLRELLIAGDALRRQPHQRRGDAGAPLETLPLRLVAEMLRLKAEAETLVADHFTCILDLARTLITNKQMTHDQVAQLVHLE